jgi:hypothetical protein
LCLSLSGPYLSPGKRENTEGANGRSLRETEMCM